MNNAEEQKGKRQEVDKLLKGLPKVQASADFEERLHRRIAETATDRPAGGWIKHVFGTRPIPALAYSLSTLVLVGIISYYAFFRSGSVPTPEQLVPPQTDNTAVRKDSGIEPPAASGKTDETTSEAPHVTSPSTAPQTRPAKPLLRQKQGRENLRDESAVNEPAFERDATESGNVTREPKKEQPAPQTQAPIPPVTQAPQPPLQEFRSNAAAVQEPESKGQPSETPSHTLLKQLQLREPSYPGKQNMSIEQQLKYVGQQIDSLGSGDSLKMDSLRQVQRYLQMQQRKAKIRKPGSE